VQQVDFGKTDPAQEIQLIGHRSRRVLAVDVVEHLPPVFLAPQRFQVSPVAHPHQLLNADLVAAQDVADGCCKIDDLPAREPPSDVACQELFCDQGQLAT